MRTRTRSARSDALSLAVGSAVAGVLAYLVFAVTTRTLDDEGAAAVSVLWTWWALSAAAISFPLQHWITQSVARHDGAGAVRRALPLTLAASAGVTVACGIVSWLLREPLFHRDDLWFPLLVTGLLAGSVLSGLVRGGLAARHDFRGIGASLVLENGFRTVGVIALSVAGLDSAVLFGLVIVAGNLTGLVWPQALRFGHGADASDGPGRSLSFLASASAGQLVGQLVLTGAPVLLALSGGSAAGVTSVFAALALYRAPYTVALGVMSQITGRMTTLVVDEKADELALITRVLAAGAAVLALVAGGLGAVMGPWLVRTVFGSGVDLDATASAWLAVGSAFAVANLVTTVAMLAHGVPRHGAMAWCIGVLVAAPVLAVDLDAAVRVAIVFAVAQAAAFVVMLTIHARAAGRLA